MSFIGPSNTAARLQLLVLASALALLAFAAVAAGSAARGRSYSQKCIKNLQEIGRLSVLVACADSRMIPHRQSLSGTYRWLGLGSWDWGGANGLCEPYAAPSSPDAWINSLSADTRPYNATAFGFPVPPSANFSGFACPEDAGFFVGGNQPPPYVPPTCGTPSIFEQSVFQATGTSYQGDFLWFSEPFAGATASLRFGSFMRPYELFPKLGETVLFYDSRYSQAVLSTQEAVDAGIMPDIYAPTTIPPWHSPGGFNVLFVDGHVQTIPIHVSGSLLSIVVIDPVTNPYRTWLPRGNDWRWDALPERFVIERRTGNPILAPPTQGLMLPRPPSDLRSGTP
jgi:prepilin-type processing-associated H-X9-DG protein